MNAPFCSVIAHINLLGGYSYWHIGCIDLDTCIHHEKVLAKEGDLCKEAREESVGGNVERHPQAEVC